MFQIASHIELTPSPRTQDEEMRVEQIDPHYFFAFWQRILNDDKFTRQTVEQNWLKEREMVISHLHGKYAHPLSKIIININISLSSTTKIYYVCILLEPSDLLWNYFKRMPSKLSQYHIHTYIHTLSWWNYKVYSHDRRRRATWPNHFWMRVQSCTFSRKNSLQ